MTLGVKRQLVEAGIDPDAIPMDWLEASVAATFKWMSETSEGGLHGANILELEWFRGDDGNQYKIHDHQQQAIRSVKSEDVYFLRGAVIEGRTVPFSQVSSSRKENESCDCCGINSHCTKDIRDPSLDRMERLCNNCMIKHEHPKVRDEGDQSRCENCTVLTCPNNPARERRA